AQAYAQEGHFDRAALLAARLAHRPGWEVRGDLLLGVLRIELNDPFGAAEAMQKALRRDPTLQAAPGKADSFRKLQARVLLRTERPGEARALLRTVLATGPDPEASWLLSRAALQDGDVDGVKAALVGAGSYRDDHRQEPEPGPYVGERRCAECHSAISAAE